MLESTLARWSEVEVKNVSSPTAEVYGRAVTLGFVAGLRSQLPLALLGLAANRGGFAASAPPPLGWLRSPRVAAALGASALGEAVGDKLPFVPNRIEPGPLGGRIVFGGLAGAAVTRDAGRPAAVGAALGAIGGAAGSFAGYEARAALGRGTTVPDTVWAIGEDVLAFGLGLLATPWRSTATRPAAPRDLSTTAAKP